MISDPLSSPEDKSWSRHSTTRRAPDDAAGSPELAALAAENERLRRSEANLIQLFNQAPAAMLVVDTAYRIIFANLEAAALVGQDADALQGRPFLEIFDPGEQQEISEHLAQALHGGVAHTGLPCHITAPDGNLTEIDVSIRAASWSNEPAAFVVLAGRSPWDQAFRSRAELLEAVFAAAPVGISLFDRQHRLVEVNPALGRLLEIDRSRLPDGDPVQRTHLRGDGTPMPAEEMPGQQAVRTGRTTVDTEIGILKDDGQTAWVSMSAAPLPGMGAVVTTIDITDRRRLTESVRQQGKFIETVLDTVASLVVVIDRAGRIVRFNRACEELFGFPLADVRGRPIWDLLPDAVSAAEIRRAFGVVARGHTPGVVELEWVTRAGQRRLLRWAGAQLNDNAGEFAYFIGTGTDITDQRELDTLRIKNAVIESSLNAIMISDLDGAITYVNQAFLDIWGFAAPGDALGLQAADLVEDRPTAEQVIETLRKGGGWVGEHTAVRADGARRIVRWAATLVTDRTSQPLCLTSAFIDITDSRKASDALAHYAAELERSNADLERFAYSASHDLQEPLRMVASYVQLLADDYGGRLSAEAEEYIGFAVDGVRRMQQLIADLLTYARVSARPQSLQAVDCGQVISEALLSLRLASEETGATVRCGFMPTVQGDRSQLMQLFFNLIGNAIKFHGSQPPEVEISARLLPAAGADEKAWWLFTVRDNGIGIAPEHQARVFEVFQRLYSRGEYPGTGIGLAICKRIVERHGGRIWVESAEGSGATFYFTLPALEVEGRSHAPA